MKQKLYSSQSLAKEESCCNDAVTFNNGVYYVNQDCDCKEEKELKVDEIKVTKEYKIGKKESK